MKFRGLCFIEESSLESERNGGYAQIVAVHEAGHMIGGADMYPPGLGVSRRANPGESPMTVDLIEREFGPVTFALDDRVMSGGMRILPQDFVVVLLGLRDATRMNAWGFTRKSPRAVP